MDVKPEHQQDAQAPCLTPVDAQHHLHRLIYGRGQSHYVNVEADPGDPATAACGNCGMWLEDCETEQRGLRTRRVEHSAAQMCCDWCTHLDPSAFIVSKWDEYTINGVLTSPHPREHEWYCVYAESDDGGSCSFGMNAIGGDGAARALQSLMADPENARYNRWFIQKMEPQIAMSIIYRTARA